MIEEAARERYNDGAAMVIRAVLKATEAKQLKLSDVRSGQLPHHCSFPTVKY